MSNQILVTGGSGYIGSPTCKALARRGWTPVVVDDLVRGHAEAVRWGPLPVLVADATLARRVLEWSPGRSSLEEIVHSAWRWQASRATRGRPETRPAAAHHGRGDGVQPGAQPPGRR